MTKKWDSNGNIEVKKDSLGMVHIVDTFTDTKFVLYPEEAQELCYRLGITLQNLNSSNPPPDQF